MPSPAEIIGYFTTTLPVKIILLTALLACAGLAAHAQEPATTLKKLLTSKAWKVNYCLVSTQPKLMPCSCCRVLVGAHRTPVRHVQRDESA